MDILVVLLRLTHIVAAFVWVGLGVATNFYIAPALGAAGESGWRSFKSLMTNTNYPMAFPAAAGLTTLAGLLLYVFGNTTARFSTTGNIVLGIGAVAGLLAMAHGATATGGKTRDLGKSLMTHVKDGQPIAPEGLAEMNGLAAELRRHSQISVIIMLLALVGMASARYL
jgi:hypothetical protein